MNERSRRVLYLVGAIYLVYLGIKLISEQLQAPTSNAVVAWAGAILFLVFGVGLAISTLKKFVVDFKEQEADESGDEIETVEVIEEKEEIEE